MFFEKILMVGFGSIARRHLSIIKMLCPKAPIALLREFSKDKNIGSYQSAVDHIFTERQQALAWQPTVVIITNPAPYHISIAYEFLQQDAHLLIEKPLSTEIEAIDELCQMSDEKKTIAMVAYVMRFSKPLTLMKQWLADGRLGQPFSIDIAVGSYLPKWRPTTDYRQGVTARQVLGGGVLFELSHELDYARWLFGEITQVSAMTNKVSALEIDTEDLAQINLRFVCGALGHIHLDMLDHATHRRCRIIGSEGTLVWTLSQEGHHSLQFFHKTGEEQLLLDEKIDSNEAYVKQMQHFLDCIRQKRTPLITLREGQKTLATILAAKASAQQAVVVSL